MISSPGPSYYPAVFLTRINPRHSLQKPKSLQILSANTTLRTTLNSRTRPRARSSIILAILLTRSFQLDRALRSGPSIMGDASKMDGLAGPNGRAIATTPSSLANYSFPESRLKTLSDTKKIPVILMACGSLSVPEYSSKPHDLFY